MEPWQCFERTKRLVVFIKGQWDFEVKFSVTKRRKVRSTLLELAAEAVANQVQKEEDIDTSKLEVAETLQDVLLENFHDITWVRKHWKAPERQVEAVDEVGGGKEVKVGAEEDEEEEVEVGVEDVGYGCKANSE